jgi:hypothetical protein
MPSVADLIFVTLLSLLLFTPWAVRLLGDAGIGWHIRTGQQILATHSVPRVDSFSSTMSGKPWFAWEWLYDVVVGQLDVWAGLNGVVWFTAVLIAAVFAGTFRALIVRGTNVLAAFGVVLLALGASTIHFLARPHVLSWLFTLIWFWILDSSERDGNRRNDLLWLLPVSMFVWVNSHGGFLVGFVLLAIWWLAAIWKWQATKEGRIEEALAKLAAAARARKLLWVGFFSVLASLVNPYGWKLYAHIYSYLSNRFLMDHIDEFQSPNFHRIAPRCFLVLLLVVVACVAIRGRELRLSHGLVLLFATYSGLYSARNIPVSAMLLALVVGPLICRNDRPGDSQSFLQRMTTIDSRQYGHLWAVVIVMVTLGIAVNQRRLGSMKFMDAHFDSHRMPVAAVDYLETHPIKGAVLSPDIWGGYLIYRLAPETQVVVDDRHDLYGAEFFKSYLRMMHVEPGWQDFVREHHPSCLLLPRESALSAVLLESGKWKQTYQDDTAIVLVPE